MPPDSYLQPRVTALEIRTEEVSADATAALRLATAHDRTLADLTVKVDANTTAIKDLGVQTAARFDRLETRFDGLETRFGHLETKVDANRKVINALGEQTAAGFAAVRARLDQTAAGIEVIGNLLTTLIEREEE